MYCVKSNFFRLFSGFCHFDSFLVCVFWLFPNKTWVLHLEKYFKYICITYLFSKTVSSLCKPFKERGKFHSLLMLICSCLLMYDKCGLKFCLNWVNRNLLPVFILLEAIQIIHEILGQWFPNPAPRTIQLVVHEIGWSGPRIPIKINILCFVEHQIIPSGPRTGKVWEPLL